MLTLLALTATLHAQLLTAPARPGDTVPVKPDETASEKAVYSAPSDVAELCKARCADSTGNCAGMTAPGECAARKAACLSSCERSLGRSCEQANDACLRACTGQDCLTRCNDSLVACLTHA